MMRRRTAPLLLFTFALSWGAVPRAFGDGPKCLLREGFEGEGTAYRLKPGAVVVSREQGAEPHAGNRCLRGNWDPKVTNPITGIAAVRSRRRDGAEGTVTRADG